MDTRKNKDKITAKRLHSIAVVLVGGAGLAVAMQGLLSFFIPAQAETISATSVDEEIRTAKNANPFQNISIEARAGYVLDLKTGAVLYAKNENEKLR